MFNRTNESASALLVAQILRYIVSFAPLIFTDLPWWACIIVAVVMLAIPIVGGVCEYLLWAYVLVERIIGPQSWFSIIYYILFAIFAISRIVMFATSSRKRM